MARTRSDIITLVNTHTGFSGKSSLQQNLCNDALKVAIMKHSFREATLQRTWAITEGNDEVQVQGTGGEDDDTNSWKITDVVTARIIDTSGDDYAPLRMKNRIWWDKNVVSGEDNQQGWPTYGIRLGDYFYFERPVEANRSLYLRCTNILTFSEVSTECPIENLDMFVEQYVTAHCFLDIHEHENYKKWIAVALVSLGEAIETDTDTAEEKIFERAGGGAVSGVSVNNLTDYTITGKNDPNMRGTGAGGGWY